MTTPFNPDYILPGARIGPYVVHTQIGRGGSGAVYDVSSAEGHHLALKVCRWQPGPPGSPQWEADKRYSRGIVCMENLCGVRNVAQIFAHDRYPDPFHGHQYVVMELVPGGLTITSWVKKQSPSLVDIVTAFQELAELCGELAHADIRHRDLKPENVLVAPGGIPKVVDFESAICHRAEPLTRPAASALPATRGFQSPELALAFLEEKQTGKTQPFHYLPWSDLHALGVIFYEVLTGEHPFDLSRPDSELLCEIAFEKPIHPMLLNGRVPFGLNKVVVKLLEKNPMHRYQHGDRVAEDLRALLENVADDSWTHPFQHSTHEDVAAMRPRIITAAAARADEAFTAKEAPRTTSIPAPVIPALALPEPVVVRPRPKSSRTTRAALSLGAALAAAGAGAIGWLLAVPPPAPPSHEAVASVSAEPRKGALVPSPVPELSTPPEPVKQKQTSSRARKLGALATAAATAATLNCATLKPRPTPESELAWLESCPAESREVVKKLGIYPGGPNEEGPGFTVLYKQPNVLPKKIGCEVKEGEVEVAASLSPSTASGKLVGKIIEGTDRVYFRFHELRRGDEGTYPICAIAAASFTAWGPGVHKVKKAGLPASELNPDFLYITTGRLRIRVAPYIPSHESGNANVN